MNVRGHDHGWHPRLLAAAIGVLTVVQSLVVLRWAAVPDIPLPIRPAEVSTTLLWSTRQVESAFVGVPRARRDMLERDPEDAFQSMARLSLHGAEYRPAEFREPDRWLTNPPSLPAIAMGTPQPRSDAPEAFRPPASVLARPATSRQTASSLGGTLASRRWLKAPVLGPWPGPETPGTTRIEVAVNRQGWFVLARVSESSGSREADDLACKSLHDALLTPEAGAPPRPRFGTEDLAWGTVSIEWGLRP